MVANGDKLIVEKNVEPFLHEGDVVEITNVTDDGVISFAFGDGLHMGVMSADELESHFKKVEEDEGVKPTEITEEYIAEIMDNCNFEIHTAFGKCTIVSCRLPNGFVITESSACVNPEDYDEGLGADICFNKIADKIWELEAYRLQQELYETGMVCNCECCDNCPCEECEEEFDECLDTDLDCDDCEDLECPYRAL